MLAKGGYIVGKMATLLYPEGIDIEGNTKDCIEKTQELLKQEKVVLFEASILSGQKLIRVDILVKDRKQLHLVEVNAKSHDSQDKSRNGNMTKYVEDIAFQYYVWNESFSWKTCLLVIPTVLFA